MLCGIQPDNFLLLCDTQPKDGFDRQKGDCDRHYCPQNHTRHSRKLDSKQLEAAPVKKPRSADLVRTKCHTVAIASRVGRRCVRRKEADCNSPPNPIQTVHRHCAHGVINMKLVIQKPDAKYHQQTGNRANHDRAKGICHITPCGNCHQPGKRRIQAHGHIRLAVFYPSENHADHGRNCRGDRCRHKD